VVLAEDFTPSNEDLEHIVRCVNAHEGLVEALQAVMDVIAPVLRDGVRLADVHDDPDVIWPDLAVLRQVEAALAAAGVTP